jgi:hypothetical protein
VRLSAWRAAAPNPAAVTAKVAAVVDPVLVAFGAEEDPHCWVAWGDEPGTRFTILVPTDPGLITCFVRVNVPMEGPRASAKLIRWNRVAIGELGVETQAGHRILSFQVEQNVLRGVDGEADLVDHCRRSSKPRGAEPRRRARKRQPTRAPAGSRRRRPHQSDPRRAAEPLGRIGFAWRGALSMA